MKTIDDYAEEATRQIGRYYGATRHLMDNRPYVRCQDFLKAHWRRFPHISPDGGKTIDNEAPAIAKPTEAPKPRIIEP